MPPGVIHCRDAGGHTPYIYGRAGLGVADRCRLSRIVAASDHEELEAEVSGTVVNRITFDGNRIAQVSRAPGGFPPNAAAAWLGAPA